MQEQICTDPAPELTESGLLLDNPLTVTGFHSHNRWPDGSPPQNLRGEAPSATPQEGTSAHQTPDFVDGRLAPFYAFAPILSPSPLPLTFATPYSIPPSYTTVESPTDQSIATSKVKLRLQHRCRRRAQRLANLPVSAAAAANENASVENRWCRLRDTVQSTALAVLGRARRQHQDWFHDSDAAISNLLTEKNRLHKAYGDRTIDDNRAVFYRSRRLARQRLRELQDNWTARRAKEVQGYAGRNE
nr:unnamed protein product [Spirometra erinaceieuropaei]